MQKILTLKPNDPDVIYYTPWVRSVNGRLFHENGDGKYVYDFFHDDDDLIGSKTITEKEALEAYSKYYDSKEFYNCYS